MYEWPVQVKVIPDDCIPQWICHTITSSVAVNYPSDGLLPDYTQKLKNLPSGNYYTIKGANHIEVRNMSNSSHEDITRQRFNEIWNRHPDDFFHTDERPQ